MACSNMNSQAIVALHRTERVPARDNLVANRLTALAGGLRQADKRGDVALTDRNARVDPSIRD